MTDPLNITNIAKGKGKVLGQETGGDHASRVAEATKIIGMVNPIRRSQPEELLGSERAFLTDMSQKLNQYGSGLVVSGRQLFRLREIKDRLVDQGVL